MKLIHLTSVLLASTAASAKSSSHQNSKSIAGLQELQKLAKGKERDLRLFDLFGGLDCDDTLTTCEQVCGDGDAADTAVERLSLFDSSVEPMCGNCKFYKCCRVSGEESYESCKDDNLPDMDSLLPDGWDPEDLPDMDSLFDGWDLGDLPDMIDSLFPDNDGGAVSSGTDSASGLSVLGQLVDSFCPETCTKKELCDSGFMLGMGDQTLLEEAYNLGCLPVVPSCGEICDNADGSEFLGSVVDMACDSCNFLECCAQSNGFETCQDLLPNMGDLLPDIDWDTILNTEWDYTANWGASVDWSGFEAASGLSELVENLHSLFDEALTGFDSFPVTCNSDTCPIDGVCEMSVNLANVEDACAKNAFFACAEGLEDMCANECESGMSDHFLSTGFCSLCNIAECCSKNGTASFEDCALGAISQEISDAVENIINFDQLSTFIEEVVGDASIPEFCPEVDGAIACPVEGFCDIFSGESTNFDLASVNYEEACSDNALFLCGPQGFEDMCNNKCDPGSDDFLNAAFCSLCSIATCCKDKGNVTSFGDCALDSLPQDFTLEDSNGSLTGAPVQVQTSPSESSGSTGTPASDPLDAPIIAVESLDSSPQDLTPEDSTGSPNGAPIEVSPPESSGSPDTPTEDSSSELLDSPTAAIDTSLEVSLASTPDPTPDSGSHVSEISMSITLASIATLFFVSF